MNEEVKNDSNLTNSKKNKKGLIIGLAVVVLIVAIVIAAALILFKSPISIFESAIHQTFSKMNTGVEKYMPEKMDYKENDISVGGKLSFDTSEDLAEYEDLKNYSIDFDIKLSMLKKIMKIDLGIKEKNKDFLSANIIAQDNKMYAKVPDLLNKILLLDEFDWDENIQIEEVTFSKKDYKVILSGLEKVLIDSLNKDKIVSKKGITLTGFDKKVNELVYTFDEENQKQIVQNYLSYVKNNSDYSQALANITEKDVEQIIEELESEIEDFTYSKNIIIKLYTQGLQNEIVEASFEQDNQTITMIKEENDVKLVIDDVEIIISEEKDTTNIKWKSSENSGTIKLNYLKENDSKISMNMEIYLEQDDQNYQVNLELNMDQDANVTKENVKNATSINELTTEELQKLYLNFINKIQGTPFETILSDLFAGNV